MSGGLDSTYLVYHNLKEGNTVYPVYIEITNNQIKSVLEKNRIELLVKEFRKEFGDSYPQKIHDINYIATVGVDACEGALYLRQVPVWILGLSFMQSMDIDEIQIGYVSNDDAISYLDDIQNIYKSYQAICEPMKPLAFPLTKKHKWQIVDELPQQYMELIISCEGARIVNEKDMDLVAKNAYGVSGVVFDHKIEYEPCCECVPCKTIIASDYYGRSYFPENYKKNLLAMQVSKLNRQGFSVKDEKGNDYGMKEGKLDWCAPKFVPYQLELALDWCQYERHYVEDSACEVTKYEAPYSYVEQKHLDKLASEHEKMEWKSGDAAVCISVK